METKDWIYAFGLLLTFGVSSISLYLNFQSRRKGIMEHLYKEQLAFFVQLAEIMGEVDDRFSDICIKGDLSESESDDLEALLEKPYRLIIKNEILIPNQKISDSMENAVIVAYDIEEALIKKKGKMQLSELKPFIKAYDSLVEELRAFMGVEALSKDYEHFHSSALKNIINQKRLTDIAETSINVASKIGVL